MSKLVTVFGGSGFLGRYIVQRLAQEGWRVRVAVRKPNEAQFLKPYGVVGQVAPVFCNIRDDQSVARVLQGADAVVNCVGILVESGKATFKALQSDGAERIARLSAEAEIGRVVQISAIGADVESDSDYARTKAEGEQSVIHHRPQAVILRPSIMFGAEDEFFNRFASMSRFGPVLPVVGADTLFQPVYVDDVAAVAVKAINGEVAAGVYELGGPETLSFRALMHRMLDVIRRRRLVLSTPFPVATLMGASFDLLSRLTNGLMANKILTRDQVRNLRRDNVVSYGAQGFGDLGMTPTPLESVLPDYLWRFRPTGQYEEMTESARNLKP